MESFVANPACNNKIPDQLLVEQLISGSDDALALLFTRYNRKIFLYCAKLLKNPSQAEDVAQEIWLRIIELRQKPIEVQNPAAFLFTMARNACLNLIRTNSRTSSLEQLSEKDQPGTSMSDNDGLILDALNLLNFEEREIIVLNIYCGYDFSEIAEMYSISVNAAWTRASRARKKLRETVLSMLRRDQTPQPEISRRIHNAE